MSLDKIEQIYREATKCRVCFSQISQLESSLIDVAQPRWIGPNYWTASKRVTVVMLNPGSGAFRKDSGDSRSRELIIGFRDGQKRLDAVFEHQAADMPNWGRGRFQKFYFEDLGLKLAETAFANIAWCGTSGNKYPANMLDECFRRHTRNLLVALVPQVLILSGSAVHRYQKDIKEALPGVAMITTLHFAHRKGHQAGSLEAKRVRAQLEKWR